VLTRSVTRSLVERARKDSAFARALLDEAVTLFLNGEAETARLVLRDLVEATVGLETLAAETGVSPDDLSHKISKSGNPTMDELAAILAVLRKKLGVELQAHAVEAA
jgi:DNA-binding phage protein